MTELNSEMAKLNKGIEKNNKEQQSLPSLEKKVKEMALEITGDSDDSISRIRRRLY